MPSLLCLVLDRSPYGGIEPAEAIRHTGGALGKGWQVVLAFMGQSVYTALRGQSPPAGEWLSLSAALSKVLDDGQGRACVLVDAQALDARGLVADDLIPGARPASTDEIAHALATCDRALLF
ncbi:MAG: DsrE family protein [Candidatus Rokubacteria bacterium]|nr:DsrE family protein [Candidatus Rokubacteria bacterium]